MKKTPYLFLVFLIGISCQKNQQQTKIDFNKDIRPIFNNKCIVCHGGVKRASGFSLLFRSEALEPNDSGKPAIVPGFPEESTLIELVNHADPAERMPKNEGPLSRQEIDLLKKWITDGAKWETHWAYKKPQPIELPPFSTSDWLQNGIDYFILSKLLENNLEPSTKADRSVLLRRVSLDLTGLPPTSEETDSFLSDSSSNAFEKVVDRLLASPRYGERWAGLWLDLARYADTKGYERDPAREIWPYRDWLIKAFNSDLPFDDFTIEQLAGDLLPNPAKDQYIATAFHRNTMNNDEGGTDNEEYRIAAVIDRVNTTFDVWQGTTFGCVQCHAHAYDPFTHEDYYKVFAIFNNSRDEDTPHESPVLKMYNKKDEERIDKIRQWVISHSDKNKEILARKTTDLLYFSEPKIHPHNFEIIRNGTHADTKYLMMYKDGLATTENVNLGNKNTLMINYNWGKNGTLMTVILDSLAGDTLLTVDVNDKHKGHFLHYINPPDGRHDLYLTFQSDSLEVEQGAISINWFLLFEGLPGKDMDGYGEIEELFLGLLNKKSQTVPILVENDKDFTRDTFLFARGNWLDPAEKVAPGVPASLPPLLPDDKVDRMTFAKWLVSPENPLTARVAVNRFWEQLFGIGIVETVEDFGTQGAKPSHPELLDWLAQQFIYEHDWSIKSLLKQIVMSATYQQAAIVNTDLLQKDPRNRLLARGPRNRLSAEMVRDQALAVSGLLSEKMFGPSVKPFQPDGVWQIIYSSENWETSTGEDQHRRALYTYWRRTSPYPSMITFDSPSREFCVARRISTNTPLQALVTLNDPVYFEAARALAKRMLKENDEQVENQIKRGYKIALAKGPDHTTYNYLLDLYNDTRRHFEQNPQALKDFSGKGGEPMGLGCLTIVANSIMNLDEFLNK